MYSNQDWSLLLLRLNLCSALFQWNSPSITYLSRSMPFLPTQLRCFSEVNLRVGSKLKTTLIAFCSTYWDKVISSLGLWPVREYVLSTPSAFIWLPLAISIQPNIRNFSCPLTWDTLATFSAISASHSLNGSLVYGVISLSWPSCVSPVSLEGETSIICQPDPLSSDHLP